MHGPVRIGFYISAEGTAPIAAILRPDVVAKILDCLDLPADAPPILPARAPPEPDLREFHLT